MHRLCECVTDSPHLISSKQRRISIPAPQLFVSRKKLVLHTEGAAGRSGLQVEFGHVQHREVDRSVVSAEGLRNLS